LLVAHKPIEAGQQKRTEMARVAFEVAQDFLFNQSREEPLNQVFCVMSAMPSSARVGIKRIPIRAAQLLQRRAR
jgi:hypothetical protein